MNKILQNTIDEKEYRKLKALNYSTIKTFEISPLYYKNLVDGKIEEKPKDYFELGKAIHCAVLEPNRWEKEYVRCPSNIPTGIIGNFTEELIKICKEKNKLFKSNVSLEEYGEAYSLLTTNWKLETVINKFNELDNRRYFDFVMQNSNKTIIPENDYNIVLECKNSILKHRVVNHFITHSNSVSEFSILWKYENLELKSKLDKIILVEDIRKAYLIELKTTGKPASDFIKSYYNFKYYIQLSFYIDALKCYLEANGYLDYEIIPIIIVVETKPFHETRVFQVDELDIQKGKQEYESILKRIEWHTNHKNWNYPKEYYEETGIEKINVFKSENEIIKS